ncbi:MAG: fibronectin type III domain-containing protein [Gemmatimonadetes bacterium]|nr:fibronectin type III domain-containing protein [Gemmatimonadota bacterium]
MTIRTDDADLPKSAKFTVTVEFSEDVDGFSLRDVDVTHGSADSFSEVSADEYEFDVEPEDDYEGPLTVRIRTAAVRSVSTDDPNDAESEEFLVDTIEPELDDATVEGDELVLEYDEDLDERSVPRTTRFDVTVDGANRFVEEVDIRDDRVTLTLESPVDRSDNVRIDYDHGSQTSGLIQDEAGNEADEFTNRRVTNNTRTSTRLPSAPRGLTATADGQAVIELDWRAPVSSGTGGSITGYRIEVSSNEGDTWRTLESDTRDDDTEYRHTGLDPGTTRHYRVSAWNDEGRGPVSDTASATTDSDRPGKPTGLTARANGRTQIDLSWTAPSNVGGGITGYRVQVSTNEGSSWTDLESNTRSTRTTYPHSGLAAGTTRHYRVAAISSADRGDWSNVANATTDIGRPSAPLELSATAVGQTSIRLAWTSPNDPGGAPITAYRIEVSRTGTSGWLPVTSSNRTRTYTHTGLNPGSRRYYRVAAINSQGRGAYSRVAFATTSAAVPGAPTGLAATARGTSRIDLAWRAPLSDGGARITGYRIESSSNGSTWTALRSITNSTATTFSHTGLSPAATRHYRVFAINSAGTGPASNIARATTDATVPTAPTGLSARAVGQSRIDLSWNRPSDDGGAAITGYRIESSPNGTAWSPLRGNTNSTATTFSHTGLSPATTRHYRVRAINSAGPSPFSNVARATTDATVPGSPTNVAAVANGTSQIDLSWTAPAFDGGAPLAGYRIQAAESRNGPWSDLVTNTRSTSTQYSHTGLAPATTRHYRVAAINRVGRGSESGVASATTDATVPDPPTALQATATLSTRIDLTWTAPNYDGGAPISGYRIEVRVDSTTWTDLVESTGVSATGYQHAGLKPGSTRHYRVSAVNVAGTGQPSNVASATTDDPLERAGRLNKEILPHASAAMTSSTIAAIASRVESFVDSDPFGRQVGLGGFSSLRGTRTAGRPGTLPGAGGSGGASGVGAGFDVRQLLDGTSFHLPLGGEGAQQQGIGGLGLATWGRGEFVGMARPRGGLVEWDGDMLNLHAGADVRVLPHLLAGVAATRSTGDFAFTDRTGESPVEGTYASRMTSLNPYVAGFLGTVDVAGWITGGYGWGTVDIEDDREELRSSNLTAMTGAAGVSGVLLAGGEASLRLKGEGWLTRVEVQGSERVDPVTLDMRRARASLEWRQGYEVYAGHEVAAVLESGARYDNGDAGIGAGLEIGGGLQYASPGGRLKVEGRGRILAIGHAGYEEWGASGMIQFDSHARSGRGLSVRLVPEWGEAGSGVQALWDQGVSGMPAGDFDPAAGRVNAEVRYGLLRNAGTPYARLYVVNGGTRAFGGGMRYEITRVLDLRLEGTRVQSALAPARHGLTVRGTWNFGRSGTPVSGSARVASTGPGES